MRRACLDPFQNCQAKQISEKNKEQKNNYTKEELCFENGADEVTKNPVAFTDL